MKTWLGFGGLLLLFIYTMNNGRLASKASEENLKRETIEESTVRRINRSLASKKKASALPQAPSVITDTNKSAESSSAVTENLRAALQWHEACLASENCLSSEADSRHYELSLANNLREKIEAIYKQIVDQKIKMRAISALARDLLKVDDGGVKEVALRLLLSQEAEAENVAAVSVSVFEYHDGNLVPSALEELKRHLDGPQALEVHTTIRNTLKTGSLLIGGPLSESLGPLINRGSVDFYRSLVRDASLGQKVRSNVLSQLEEWQLHESGG